MNRYIWPINMLKLFKDLQLVPHLSIFRSIATSSKCNGKLVLPQRIEREATDILKALASTVKQDVNGPHYKYHDDPYLTPISNIEKRKYALSKESGRKAARYIRDKNHGLFNHRPDDPIIEQFVPKIEYNESADPTEEILLEAIRNTKVSEATEIYKACNEKDIELSTDCLQSLLELISFYNCEDAIDEDWIMEIETQPVFERKILKTWKDSSVAEEIFNKISSHGSRPYCALIRGMCKFYQVDRAWQLYQESLDKKIKLDTETFGSIISIVPVLWDAYNLRWENVENLLAELKSQGHPPTLSLMNRILDVLDRMAQWDNSSKLSLRVLKEFKLLGIEPSLGSYSSLLGQYRRRGAKSPMLASIMNEIEGKSFSIVDPKDTWFFFKAMEICHRNLQDWNLSQRIHGFVLSGDNYNLMGESIKEAIYYRHYIIQAIESLPVSDFMQIYDNLVPNIYSPEKLVMEELLKSIGVQDAIEFLPRIWSEIIQFDFCLHDAIVETALMVVNRHDLEETDDHLREQLINSVWDIWTRINTHIEDEFARNKRIEWSGAMYGDCMMSISRMGDQEKVKLIVDYITDNPNLVIGHVPIEVLGVVVKGCKTNKDIDTWMNVLKYMKEHEFEEMGEFVREISAEELTPHQKDTLKFSFGVRGA